MAEPEFKPDYPTEIVTEGKVHVLVPRLEAYRKEPSDYAPSKAPVFYNPVMELNRDLAVLAFQAYQRRVNRDIVICEPLTSSGIRAVRLATEVHGVKQVVAADINERAYQLAKHNIRLNGVEERVVLEHMDANCLLSCHGAPHQRFDAVDVDPFGSPVPFLDSAVRALRNNGILAATATDMAPLCGVHPKACVRKYGGKPLRTEYCHELAVRLLAGCVVATAARQDIGARFLFSHCSNHYIRVYAEISYGAKKADDSLKQTGFVLHCFNCLHRETARNTFVTAKCPECGAAMDWAGPLWLGKIFDAEFCESVAEENRRVALRNGARIANLLALASDEAKAPPTYYVLDKVSNKLGLPVSSVAEMLRSLRDNGFKAAPTHFNSRGIRTDAPALFMQNLLRKTVANT
ncbi:tRNA (guanine(10)-N(2))-dimethyltransferase [Candidatus Bathyarchaeota archaeon A05DMB-2]|jgi:tRNA (guanine26-N2/guanine27-N2)-dimethyltransferase|nr:tRNA (guanine(10)-N(2))-dimethyltransferase [Candidatus Bathyarchaeota archaeon A05DMB-2]